MSPSRALLGEVAELVRGITFKPADIVKLGDSGSVVCLRTKNVQIDLDLDDLFAVPVRHVRRPAQYLQPGDILISSANSWNLVGKCSWVPKLPWPASFGGFVTALRPKTELLDRRYLYHWFNSSRTQRLVRSFGQRTTNISNLDLDRCRSMDIPLPPVQEQQRIAAALDAADALRARRRQAQDKLDALTHAIFVDMFGDPRSVGRWPLQPLGSMCSSILGKMLDSKRQTGKHSRPYMRVANIQWFAIDLADVATMDFAPAERSKYLLAPDDVLVCEGGYPGRAAVWRGEIEECYFQKALHRCRPREGTSTGDFIATLLYALDVRGGLRGHRSSSTIAHLTGVKLKNMQVICPPFSLQQRFSTLVRHSIDLRSELLRSMARHDVLFASLQQRAFRGEL